MKIVILFGSPNRKGSTNILVENFVRGATESGHECEVLDVCHMDIHPCTGCIACGYEGPCVQNDDIEMIRSKLLESYMIGRQKKISGFGLDVSDKMVAIAKEKNPDYQFVSGDSVSLPYVDESMDVVMACMAYHHFPDQEQFRSEAMRVLKPGGSLYISDPRFPLIVRWIFNTIFKDAGFRTTKKKQDGF